MMPKLAKMEMMGKALRNGVKPLTDMMGISKKDLKNHNKENYG